MAEVTNNLRRFRFDHGEMTQEDLANRVGVSRQTIIAIESGRYTPSWAWPSASPASSNAASKTFSPPTINPATLTAYLTCLPPDLLPVSPLAIRTGKKRLFPCPRRPPAGNM